MYMIYFEEIYSSVWALPLVETPFDAFIIRVDPDQLAPKEAV